MEPDLVVWTQKTWKLSRTVCLPFCLALSVLPCSGKTRNPLTIYQNSGCSIPTVLYLTHTVCVIWNRGLMAWKPTFPFSLPNKLVSLVGLFVCWEMWPSIFHPFLNTHPSFSIFPLPWCSKVQMSMDLAQGDGDTLSTSEGTSGKEGITGEMAGRGNAMEIMKLLCISFSLT